MYNVADATIVGRFLGPKALAAVGASSSVQFLVLGFCIGICCGFGIPIAQRFGGKDYRPHARLYLAQHFYHDCCRRPADNDLRPTLPCYFTYFNHTSQHL